MGIQLQVVHWLGVGNVLADYLSSNMRDPMEWSLDRQMVRHLFEMCGRLQLDHLASANITHLPLWYSQTSLGGYRSDRLITTMERVVYVCCSPFLLLPKPLTRMWVDGAEKVIVLAPT